MAVSVSMIKAGSADRMARYYDEQREVEEELSAKPENRHKTPDELRGMARVEVARRHPEEGQSAEEAAAAERAAIQREKAAGSTAYYSTAQEESERLSWIRGGRAGESVRAGELSEHFNGSAGGRRLDDPRLQSIKKAARLAEYSGELTPTAIEALRSGVHPDTGVELTGEAKDFVESAWSAKDRKAADVTAVDVTFSAPKAVSLLAAFGDRDTSQSVIAAQEAAVLHALEWADSQGVIRARRGTEGAEKIQAQLGAVARKTEMTSREGDPQLHCHTLLSSYVVGADGRRSALDGQALMGASAAMDAAYRRALSAELERALGIRLEVDAATGRLDRVAGIDRKLELQYSTRRRQINESLAERAKERARLERAMGGSKRLFERAYNDRQAGETLTEAEERRADVYESWLASGTSPAAAALETRASKGEESEASARARWAADQTAPDGERLLRDAQKAVKQTPAMEWNEEAFHAELGQSLTKSSAGFSAKEVLAQALHLAPASVSESDVTVSAMKFLSDTAVVVNEQVDAEAQIGDVWVDKTKRFTTTAVIEEQQAIVEAGKRLSTKTLDAVRNGDLAAAAKIAESYGLSADQEQIFSAFTTGQRFIPVEGPAGSGKSHVLGAISEYARTELGASVTVLSTKSDLAVGLAAEIGADRGYSLEKATMRSTDEMGFTGVFERGSWDQGLSDEHASEFFAVKKAMREASTAKEEAKAEARMERWVRSLPTAKAAQWAAIERSWLETADKSAKVLGAGKARQRLYDMRVKMIEAAAENPHTSVRIDRTRPQVILLDEAGMTGDRHLLRTFEQLERMPNTIVLTIGDLQQLSAVERGGAYRQLLGEVQPIQLEETRRAKAQWEKETQLAMRALSYDENDDKTREKAQAIVQQYASQGRVDHVGDEEVAAAIADGAVDATEKRPDLVLAAAQAAQWWSDQRAERPEDDAMVLTPTRLLQTQVAEAIQEKRFADPKDELTRETKSVAVQLDDQLTQTLHKGEPIMVRSHISEKGLRNGQMGEVKSIRAGAVKVELTDERGKKFSRWIGQQHLQRGALGLAYTSTAHKAQGATVDKALYVHDIESRFADRHMVYPSMTRGKTENRVLLAGGDRDEAEESLATAMVRSEEPQPMQVMRMPLTEAEREATRQRFPNVAADKVDDIARRLREQAAREARDKERTRQVTQQRQQQALSAERQNQRSRSRSRGVEIAA